MSTVIISPDRISKHETHHTTKTPLRSSVQHAVEKYFAHLDGHATSDLYDMVISEVEEPLLQTVMKFTEDNQSLAAKILGISRGTLRKKLALYGML